MRIGVLTALLATSAQPAFADPVDRLEATGFLGVMNFSEDIGLGGSISPEQRPQTAMMFGGRLTYMALRSPGTLWLEAGPEAELSFTASWTGYGFDEDRPSYFAPVFGYRANLLLRVGGSWFQPHALAGVGGATVVSSSPYMAKETDAVFAWGVGAVFAMADRWQLRFDARQGLMESMSGGTTSNYELLVAVGSRFGVVTKPEPKETLVKVEPLPAPPEVDLDTDGDGIPDKLDACPREAETVNGIDDADGCPEADPDNDKILGTADKCPDKAEDLDKFEDADGCPDDDNDKDGIADVNDKCPLEPETMNGIADTDGCADVIPPKLIAGLQAATKATFEAKKPRLSTKGKTALDKPLGAMLANPKVKITITVHPEKPDDKATELAKKRAEAVKWYLVEQGVSATQLATVVGAPAAKKAPLLELSVAN